MNKLWTMLRTTWKTLYITRPTFFPAAFWYNTLYTECYKIGNGNILYRRIFRTLFLDDFNVTFKILLSWSEKIWNLEVCCKMQKKKHGRKNWACWNGISKIYHFYDILEELELARKICWKRVGSISEGLVNGRNSVPNIFISKHFHFPTFQNISKTFQKHFQEFPTVSKIFPQVTEPSVFSDIISIMIS